MTVNAQSKTVTVADTQFTLHGEARPSGRMSYRVADLDAALPHPVDDLSAAFGAAVKRRLRRNRDAETGHPFQPSDAAPSLSAACAAANRATGTRKGEHET